MSYYTGYKESMQELGEEVDERILTLLTENSLLRAQNERLRAFAQHIADTADSEKEAEAALEALGG